MGRFFVKHRSADVTLFFSSSNIFRTSNEVEVKPEPSDEINFKSEITDDNLPLDLSCSKSKRSCQEDYWTSQHTQAVYPLSTNLDQFQELNDLATAAMLFNNIKQEQTHFASTAIKQEPSMANFRQIEQSTREKFQYSQPLPIPDGE
jgi:hypothetical protein